MFTRPYNTLETIVFLLSSWAFLSILFQGIIWLYSKYQAWKDREVVSDEELRKINRGEWK